MEEGAAFECCYSDGMIDIERDGSFSSDFESDSDSSFSSGTDYSYMNEEVYEDEENHHPTTGAANVDADIDINENKGGEEEDEEENRGFRTPEDVGRWIRASRPMFIRLSQVQELVDRVERERVTPTQLFEMAVGNGGRGDPNVLQTLFHVTEGHVGYSLQTSIPPHVVWRNLIIAKMNRECGEKTRMVSSLLSS